MVPHNRDNALKRVNYSHLEDVSAHSARLLLCLGCPHCLRYLRCSLSLTQALIHRLLDSRLRKDFIQLHLGHVTKQCIERGSLRQVDHSCDTFTFMWLRPDSVTQEWPGPKIIKKNTNSTPNKSRTQRARAYKVTSYLSTDCELSTETCSRYLHSLGPWWFNSELALSRVR